MEFLILGPVEARDAGEPVALGPPKQRAVLAELLLRPNEAVPREELIGSLWGEAPPKTAVTTIQVYVHGLRRSLGHDRIETVGNAYRARVAEDELDLTRFERLLARARSAYAAGRARDAAADLEAALALWRGAPLADLRETGEVSLAARSLEEQRLEAAELQNDVLLALGRHELVLPGIERLVEEHPYRERLRAQQVLALYRSGRQTEALEAYRRARRAWREELGIEPTPALQELERAVLQHDPSLAAPEPAAAATRRLPAPPTPLIGRRLEIAAVSALLREEARLVTLTGPGGTGKTRLGLAVAEELSSGLADGAVFVDLSAVTDPSLVVPTIAEAVGAPPGTATSAELGDHLRDLSLLLVLDNFEQVLAGAPRLGELLAAAPRLRVLATSRAALRLAAEHLYPVLPLPLPAEGPSSTEELSRNEAVRLFTARARAADPAFELTEETAADVTAVCRRLDGLPLAIELAAARTRVLSPARLLEKLPGSLELLGDGPRDAPARHATLQATIQWSCDLLDESERQAFERLAVFSGGFPEEAALRCCDVDLGVLTRLVDHSLLRQRRGEAATRFFMLETIRQFAALRLGEREDDGVFRRHAAWVLDLAEDTDRAHTAGAGDFARALDRLAAEADNARAALAWSIDHDRDLAYVLASVMRHVWDVRGYLAEGRRWLDRVLAVAGDAPDERRIQLYGAVGKLAFHAGDFAEAEQSYGRVLEIAGATGDEEAVARGLSDLGTVSAATGDYDRAVPYLEDAAERFRALGLDRRRAIALSNLGYIAGEQKDFARAVEATEEALTLQLELDERSGAAVSLLNLGGFCIESGDTAGAREWLRRCFALARDLGYREVMLYGLLSLVRIALLEDDPHRAAYLAGAADALHEETGVGLLPAAQAEFAASKEQARAALGDSGYEKARAEGEAAGAETVLAREELAA